MDFVSIWKTVSIALTGSFGMLGLLTEFRNRQTKKITIWGWISLFGILTSAVGGVAVQIQETKDDAKRAADSLRRTETLLRNTSQTVNSINRFMATLVGATVDVNYNLDCAVKISNPCGGTPAAEEALLARDGLEAYFFVDSAAADRFADGYMIQSRADLIWLLKREVSVQNGSFGEGGTATTLHAEIDDYRTAPSSVSPSSGKVVSLLDLPSSTIIISGNQSQLNDVSILDIRIWTKDGRSLQAGPFERITIAPKKPLGGPSFTAYRFAFPRDR